MGLELWEPSVKLDGLPIPPSVNRLNMVLGSRIRSSREYREYKSQINIYKLVNKAQVAKYQAEIASWLVHEPRLRVDCVFHFKHERLYTKTGAIKRLDAHNFLKATHDAIAEIINCDDSHFFAGDCIKTTTEGDETCVATITVFGGKILMRSGAI